MCSKVKCVRSQKHGERENANLKHLQNTCRPDANKWIHVNINLTSMQLIDLFIWSVICFHELNIQLCVLLLWFSHWLLFHCFKLLKWANNNFIFLSFSFSLFLVLFFQFSFVLLPFNRLCWIMQMWANKNHCHHHHHHWNTASVVQPSNRTQAISSTSLPWSTPASISSYTARWAVNFAKHSYFFFGQHFSRVGCRWRRTMTHMGWPTHTLDATRTTATQHKWHKFSKRPTDIWWSSTEMVLACMAHRRIIVSNCFVAAAATAQVHFTENSMWWYKSIRTLHINKTIYRQTCTITSTHYKANVDTNAHTQSQHDTHAHNKIEICWHYDNTYTLKFYETNKNNNKVFWCCRVFCKWLMTFIYCWFEFEFMWNGYVLTKNTPRKKRPLSSIWNKEEQ